MRPVLAMLVDIELLDRERAIEMNKEPESNFRPSQLLTLYYDLKFAADRVRVELMKELLKEGFTGFVDIVNEDGLAELLEKYN